MSKDKPTPLLVIKTYAFDAATCHFLTQLSFSVQYLLSASVTLSYRFKSSITVLNGKYKWYLTKVFVVVEVLYANHQITYLKVKINILINIDDSKNLLNHQLNINSEKFCILQNGLENVLFSFTNLSQGYFYITKWFLY